MNYLADMIARRSARFEAEYGSLSAAELQWFAECGRRVRDFAAALRDGADVAVIGEVKKASPSAGPIAPRCDAPRQALRYQAGGAAAISVLTEPEDFGGSFRDLSEVAQAVELPVLCKDFVVDPRQLFMARGAGADAVLLMVSVLGARTSSFVDQAAALSLTPLVEVVTPAELKVAFAADAGLIAVNNRDLRTLAVDIEAARETLSLAAMAGAVVVSASGMKGRLDVEGAATIGAHAVLVGEALMRAENPEQALRGMTGVSRSP